MSELRRRWAINATANVSGGIFTAVFNLVLPAILVRHLTKEDFSTWNLALQIPIYIQLFSVGLQSGVTRYIAASNKNDELSQQGEIFGAAVSVASYCFLFAMLAVGIFSFAYPYFFPGMGEVKATELRLCVAFIGAAASVQLLSLVPAGVFVGKHKNILWVICQSLSRVLTIIGIYSVTIFNPPVYYYAYAYAIQAIVLIPLSYRLVKEKFPDLYRLKIANKVRFRQIREYCLSMSIWGFSALLISGVATTLVGRFDPQNVSAFAMAFSVTTIMIGLIQTVLSPLMANAAEIHADKERREKIPSILIRATQVSVFALLLFFIGVLLFGRLAIRLWVGDAYVESVYRLLIILSASYAIRSFCMPYALVLLAVGATKKATSAVILEGLVNVTLAVILGMHYGAKGIAYASLSASVVSVFYNTGIIFPRMKAALGGVGAFVTKGIIFPAILPTIVIAVALIY
jgi:O-antigen/teichoic acid export membrane protein